MKQVPIFSDSIRKHSRMLYVLWGITAATFISVSIGYLFGYQHVSKQLTTVQPRLAVTPTATARPIAPETKQITTAPEDWLSYSDLLLKVTVHYPKQFSMSFVQTQPYLNRVMTWYASDNLASAIQTDTFVIKNDQTINVPVTSSRRFEIEIRDPAGYSFEKIWYQFPNRHSKSDQDKFLTIELSALPAQLTEEELSKIDRSAIHRLNPQDTELFDQLVSYLEVN